MTLLPNEMCGTHNARSLHGSGPVSHERADYEVAEQSDGEEVISGHHFLDVRWKRISIFFTVPRAAVPISCAPINAEEVMATDLPKAMIGIAAVVNG